MSGNHGKRYSKDIKKAAVADVLANRPENHGDGKLEEFWKSMTAKYGAQRHTIQSWLPSAYRGKRRSKAAAPALPAKAVRHNDIKATIAHLEAEAKRLLDAAKALKAVA